jgi:hypothetical protein
MSTSSVVIAGFDPAIHSAAPLRTVSGMDAWIKSGHDDKGGCRAVRMREALVHSPGAGG